MAKLLDERDKKHVYDVLATSYLDLLKRGMIGKFERKVVSRKILDSVEGAKTYDDIYALLNSLVKNYPDFSFAMANVKSEINKVHEDQVLSHLQSFLKSAAK